MSITTKNNLVALGSEIPVMQPAAVAFFFFSIFWQPSHGDGRAMKEKERERNIYLFLGLELGIECNK